MSSPSVGQTHNNPLGRWLGAATLVVATSLSAAGQEANTGFRASFEREWDMAVWRFETIAAAIPEETYGWRPGEGVRSVSEAVMHIAHGNFGFADALGLPRPEELPEELETITDKGRVLLVLRQSVEHIKAAMEPAFAGDLDVALPNAPDQTPRDVLLRALAHANEHGGQLVAYARTNDVVPPWSR